MENIQIPEIMRKRTGIFYERASSGDPTIKIPGCENLIETLAASMKISECDKYNELLTKCFVWVRRAHHHYYNEKDIYWAMEWCNAIMREPEINIICNDPRWVISVQTSYKAG